MIKIITLKYMNENKINIQIDHKKNAFKMNAFFTIVIGFLLSFQTCC